mgnify:CR=1 FL=1
MKVYQLLNKFWNGASTIRHVRLRSQAGHEIELTKEDLAHPGGKEVPHYEEMRSTVNSFLIQGDSFTIYC